MQESSDISYVVWFEDKDIWTDRKTGERTGSGRAEDGEVLLWSDTGGKKIRNNIRGTAHVEEQGDKAREAKLRLFGHVHGAVGILLEGC